MISIKDMISLQIKLYGCFIDISLQLFILWKTIIIIFKPSNNKNKIQKSQNNNKHNNNKINNKNMNSKSQNRKNKKNKQRIANNFNKIKTLILINFLYLKGFPNSKRRYIIQKM